MAFRKQKLSREVQQLEKIGIQVFGTLDKYNFWLYSDNAAFGGVKPASILENSSGIGILKDELIKIEHGILT